MAMFMGVKRYPLALFAVFFLLLIPFQGVYGLAGQQRKPITKTLRDTHAELENDPKASLPSQFTICVSVLNFSPIKRVHFFKKVVVLNFQLFVKDAYSNALCTLT